jgi:hypothetical protein
MIRSVSVVKKGLRARKSDDVHLADFLEVPKLKRSTFKWQAAPCTVIEMTRHAPQDTGTLAASARVTAAGPHKFRGGH